MKIEDLNKNIERATKELQRQIDSGEATKEVGEFLVEAVRDRTRRGFGVDQNNKSKAKLKPLAESTKKARANLKKQGKLSAETKPNKSNLTESGDMLDSLTYKKIKEGVRITPKNQVNKDKAKYNANSGRSFLFLSKAEINKAKELLEIKLRKIMDDLLK